MARGISRARSRHRAGTCSRHAVCTSRIRRLPRHKRAISSSASVCDSSSRRTISPRVGGIRTSAACTRWPGSEGAGWAPRILGATEQSTGRRALRPVRHVEIVTERLTRKRQESAETTPEISGERIQWLLLSFIAFSAYLPRQPVGRDLSEDACSLSSVPPTRQFDTMKSQLTFALALASLPMILDAQGRPQASGLEAAVSSDHPLASAAGADVLRRGGNAIDAAITMAAVLTVTRPHMNGPGGDAFIIYYDAKTKKVYTLNGAGRAGSKATPAFFAARNLKDIPNSGILSVSVPGTPQAWADALQRFGTIPLSKALEPAIKYAEQGFPMTPRLASDVRESSRKVSGDPELSRTFMPGGAIPEVGTTLRQTDLARSLRAIAAQGPQAFYKGAIAKQIVAYMEKEGGLL